MSIFEKITVVVKYVFGGFESAADYLLGLLNEWLQDSNVSENVQKYYSRSVSVYGFLVKYQRYCPAKWMDSYLETLNAVKALIDTFSDGKVEAQEVEKVIATFKSAYAEWMKDDDSSSDVETSVE